MDRTTSGEDTVREGLLNIIYALVAGLIENKVMPAPALVALMRSWAGAMDDSPAGAKQGIREAADLLDMEAPAPGGARPGLSVIPGGKRDEPGRDDDAGG